MVHFLDCLSGAEIDANDKNDSYLERVLVFLPQTVTIPNCQTSHLLACLLA